MIKVSYKVHVGQSIMLPRTGHTVSKKAKGRKELKSGTSQQSDEMHHGNETIIHFPLALEHALDDASLLPPISFPVWHL